MQIVIDIPDELYKANNRGLEAKELWDLRVAVSTGTPLPKGHGRIIDESKIKRTFTWDNGYIDCDAPTIIEADGGGATT